MDQEGNQPQAPQAPPQPVMDIQRPSQVISPQADISASPTQPAPQQFVPNSPEPIQPTVDTQEIGAPNYNQQHVSLNKQVNKKRRGLVVLIILVVVITLGLIAAAGYWYWQSQSDKSTPTETVQSTEPTTDDGVVDETDIDATTDEVDDALNSLDDSADFGSSDLSDDGIGL